MDTEQWLIELRARTQFSVWNSIISSEHVRVCASVARWARVKGLPKNILNRLKLVGDKECKPVRNGIKMLRIREDDPEC